MITFALYVASAVSFIGGAPVFFTEVKDAKFGLPYILAVAGLGIAITHAIFIFREAPMFHPVAAPMLIASLGLFYFTAHHVRKRKLSPIYSTDAPEHLYKEGPYGWVRHPFYTCYILTYAAGAVAVPSIWTIVPSLCMVAIYVAAARFEENKFAISSLRAQHEEYKKTVGFLFPKLF